MQTMKQTTSFSFSLPSPFSVLSWRKDMVTKVCFQILRAEVFLSPCVGLLLEKKHSIGQSQSKPGTWQWQNTHKSKCSSHTFKELVSKQGHSKTVTTAFTVQFFHHPKSVITCKRKKRLSHSNSKSCENITVIFLLLFGVDFWYCLFGVILH